MFRRLVLAFLVATIAVTPAIAEAKRSSGSSRIHYEKGRHKSSHGGSFKGGKGSSHKGGRYRNSKTGNRYGKHR